MPVKAQTKKQAPQQATPVPAVEAPAPVVVEQAAAPAAVSQKGGKGKAKAAVPAAAPVAAPVVAAPVEAPAAVETAVAQEGGAAKGKKAAAPKAAKGKAAGAKAPKAAAGAKATKAAKAAKAAKAPKAPKAAKAAKAPKAPKAKATETEDASEELEGGKRSFKAMLPGSDKYEGRYTGLTPYQAANKALSKYFREAASGNKSPAEITFSIRESTRGSKRAVYTYNGRREKLDKPVEYTIKGKEGDRVVTKEYKNRLTKVKKADAPATEA
jgi:hypothetical protein